MNKEEEKEIGICDELRGQFKKNKHHTYKLLIAVIVIPTITTVLDTYVLGESAPMYLAMIISAWATYIILSIYDGVITRETQLAKAQIIKNSLAILVIEEDVKALQAEVYREGKQEVRADNYAKAMRRRNDMFLEGDANGPRTKNKDSKQR